MRVVIPVVGRNQACVGGHHSRRQELGMCVYGHLSGRQESGWMVISVVDRNQGYVHVDCYLGGW